MSRTVPVVRSPTQPAVVPPRKAAAFHRRLLDGAVLRAHRLADRLDFVPSEFGAESPVDDAEAAAVRDEWLRCLRVWAAYNPEEVFALKIGSALLLGFLVALWLLVTLLA